MDSSLRLHSMIEAVCPIEGVSITDTVNPPVVRVLYAGNATAQQIAAAQAVVQAFDWSDAAQLNWENQQDRARAKLSLTALTNPTEIAARNTQRAIYNSLVQTRMVVNQLIAWANSKGANLTPLQNRTWAQALDAVKQQIDVEGDPNT